MAFGILWYTSRFRYIKTTLIHKLMPEHKAILIYELVAGSCSTLLYNIDRWFGIFGGRVIAWSCNFLITRLISDLIIYKERYLECDWSISVQLIRNRSAKIGNNSARICSNRRTNQISRSANFLKQKKNKHGGWNLRVIAVKFGWVFNELCLFK